MDLRCQNVQILEKTRATCRRLTSRSERKTVLLHWMWKRGGSSRRPSANAPRGRRWCARTRRVAIPLGAKERSADPTVHRRYSARRRRRHSRAGARCNTPTHRAAREEVVPAKKVGRTHEPPRSINKLSTGYCDCPPEARRSRRKFSPCRQDARILQKRGSRRAATWRRVAEPRQVPGSGRGSVVERAACAECGRAPRAPVQAKRTR